VLLAMVSTMVCMVSNTPLARPAKMAKVKFAVA
jgi:hypothetical protein